MLSAEIFLPQFPLWIIFPRSRIHYTTDIDACAGTRLEFTKFEYMRSFVTHHVRSEIAAQARGDHKLVTELAFVTERVLCLQPPSPPSSLIFNGSFRYLCLISSRLTKCFAHSCASVTNPPLQAYRVRASCSPTRLSTFYGRHSSHLRIS